MMMTNRPKTQDISAGDIFDKATALEKLPDEEFQRRMDDATSPENIRTTMEELFPELHRH
jgi:hypothetical protein